jgi:hypothetical protein
MNEMHKSERAQLTYVKTIAEAESFAKEQGIVHYHSKMNASEQIIALEAFASGTPIVATYGLGVGLNLLVKGKPVTSVDMRGMSGWHRARALIQKRNLSCRCALERLCLCAGIGAHQIRRIRQDFCGVLHPGTKCTCETHYLR